MSTAYPDSRVEHEGATFWLEKDADGTKELVIEGAEADVLETFEGSADAGAFRAPVTPDNAKAVRAALPWLTPQLFGLEMTAGTGDRLGLCTPGHVLAFKEVGTINPVFAQQSTREMGRCGRTPRNVIDDATWGAFQAGWTGPVGADADHQKIEESLTACAEAGFVFFTVDPGDEMDMAAHDDDEATLRSKAESLDLSAVDTSVEDLVKRYAGTTVELESGPLVLDEAEVVRAAVKAGPALTRGMELITHVKGLDVPHEFEFAIDETDKPTTYVEHVVLVMELQRLGVELVSFAPRWVGQFEKGVEYIGPLDKLKENFDKHAEIARALGPYKLSLHSGSDKFSIYPLFAEATAGASHMKTAGTSWVEALRVIARHDPNLLLEMLQLSLESLEENRHSYHLSCDVTKIPSNPKREDADELVTALDSRQVLHVGYGATLEKYGDEIKDVLRAHEDELYEVMRTHFIRHLEPYVR
ncbi:tagaturonate epimerase family protein [Propioniciclava soli]|uniref:tagaturonate epimerase family protein n=1 Tax=Propioniciclava soli TaxID=2775081 RepID=UPI001E4134CC|nr:tagaturonate epimerase family protein [Propioniciclava soli]